MPVSRITFIPLTVGLLATILAPVTTQAKVSDTKNLAIPFTLQAPQSKWVQPWADACEEASIIMIDHYYKNDQARKIPVTTAMTEMNRLFALEDSIFRHNKDTGAAETARLVNEFLPWEAYQVTKPSLEKIKAEIDNKRPVMALVHGKALKNPNFRNGGPDYHLLVIKGYDDARGEFITNDPGFGRGLDFRYQYGKLLAALHDFVPGGKTSTGEPVVLFTQPKSTDSNSTDGDKDGLKKADEIKLGTSLQNRDSDQDGFTDGDEVANGYSPTINERVLPIGSLVRSAESPLVYFIGIGEKHPIASPEVAANHGWDLKQVKFVSQKFLDTFSTRPFVTE